MGQCRAYYFFELPEILKTRHNHKMNQDSMSRQYLIAPPLTIHIEAPFLYFPMHTHIDTESRNRGGRVVLYFFFYKRITCEDSDQYTHLRINYW